MPQEMTSPGLTSQRHSALISSDSEYFQVCFSAVHYLKISEQRWFTSEQRWKRKFSELKISAETALIFSETELIQSWTALIFSETALKLEFFRAKKSALNQSCFSAVFFETELNSADFLWNSAEKPKIQTKKSALNQCGFSAEFCWNRADNHWSLLKQLLSFLIFPWDNAEHPWSLSSISCPDRTFAIFLQGNLDITLSG